MPRKRASERFSCNCRPGRPIRIAAGPRPLAAGISTSSRIFSASSSSTIFPAVGWLMPNDRARPARDDTPAFCNCRMSARLFRRPMREGKKIIN